MTTLAVTVGDREGALTAKLDQLLPELLGRVDVVAKATTVTHDRLLAILDDAGVVVTTSEPSANHIGRHRRDALGMALAQGAERVVYMDLDHALRWVENDGVEFDDVLKRAERYDCAVIGRGPNSFAALPERLASTESIVNHIYELLTGRRWDLLMAARSLSRPAAERIVESCDVDTLGNDVAWPLFCESHGFSVGYLEAEALTYRTNQVYAEGSTDRHDHDPAAWAKRVEIAWQQVEAMMPYFNGYQPR
jgi:hypothetical protein